MARREIYDLLNPIIGGSGPGDGQIKLFPGDTLDYLSNKLDPTLTIIGGLLAVNPLNLQKLVKTFNCNITVAVGDLVYFDVNNDSTVITAVNNNSPSPVKGIVLSKPTTVTCNVLLYGVSDILVLGISRAVPVLVGTDGKPTYVRPTSGYLQFIGIAYDTNKFIFDSTTQRTKLS